MPCVIFLVATYMEIISTYLNDVLYVTGLSPGPYAPEMQGSPPTEN